MKDVIGRRQPAEHIVRDGEQQVAVARTPSSDRCARPGLTPACSLTPAPRTRRRPQRRVTSHVVMHPHLRHSRGRVDGAHVRQKTAPNRTAERTERLRSKSGSSPVRPRLGRNFVEAAGPRRKGGRDRGTREHASWPPRLGGLPLELDVTDQAAARERQAGRGTLGASTHREQRRYAQIGAIGTGGASTCATSGDNLFGRWGDQGRDAISARAGNRAHIQMSSRRLMAMRSAETTLQGPGALTIPRQRGRRLRHQGPWSSRRFAPARQEPDPRQRYLAAHPVYDGIRQSPRGSLKAPAGDPRRSAGLLKIVDSKNHPCESFA